MLRLFLIPAAALSLGPASASAVQQPAPEAFDTRHARLEVSVDFAAARLSGAMTFELENWTGRPARQVSFLLHRLMEASAVHDGSGAALPFSQDVVRFRDQPLRQVTQVVVTLPRAIPPAGRTTVRIDYTGHLTPSTEVGWLYVKDHLDTTFTILRQDGLAFPVVGNLWSAANRRMPYPDFSYDASVRVPARFVVAGAGGLTRTPHADGTITWRYQSGKPSPFLNLAIARFDTLSAAGLRAFYFPADSLGARRSLSRAQAALATLASWFGPLRGEASLTITEIPDGWGSQASLVGGIIQTAAAFRDPDQIGQLYHELSHLWNANDAEQPSPRWNEGLASFLEDLLRERLDGWTGRAAHEAQRIAFLKQQLASDSQLRSVPLLDYGKQNLTGRSYPVGQLLFATLYALLGERDFNRVVGGYYQQYGAGGTTAQLVEFAGKTAPRELGPFFDDWIFTTRWTGLLSAAQSVHDLAVHYGGPPVTPVAAALSGTVIERGGLRIAELELGRVALDTNRLRALVSNRDDSTRVLGLSLRAVPGLWARGNWQRGYRFEIPAHSERRIEAVYFFRRMTPEATLRLLFGTPVEAEGGIGVERPFYDTTLVVGAGNPAATDLRRSFDTLTTEHFEVFAWKGSAAARQLETVAQTREAALRRIAELLAVPFRGRIRLVLYPDSASKTSQTGHIGNGFASGRTIIEIFNDSVQLDPYHEVAHIVSDERGSPPAFLSEGFAVFASELLGADALKYLGAPERSIRRVTCGYLASGELFPLRRLIRFTDIGSDSTRPSIAYPEAASLTGFLIERLGDERFRELYARLKNSSSPADLERNQRLLEEAYGKDLAALEAAWRAWLGCGP